MNYTIRSLIKTGNRFVPIEDVDGPVADVDYLEGAIVWKIGSVELLSESEWDLVDQLWAYIIDGTIQLLEKGRFETYFPDQPLRLAFMRQGDNEVEVVIGDRKRTVDREALIKSFADGGKRFFARMQDLVPKRNATWKRYLDRISSLDGR